MIGTCEFINCNADKLYVYLKGHIVWFMTQLPQKAPTSRDEFDKGKTFEVSASSPSSKPTSVSSLPMHHFQGL
jgi:hypothetical protein